MPFKGVYFKWHWQTALWKGGCKAAFKGFMNSAEGGLSASHGAGSNIGVRTSVLGHIFQGISFGAAVCRSYGEGKNEG